MKRILMLISLAALLLAIPVSNMMAKAEKQDICHKGNTINVAMSAVQAHVAHGDTIGACGGSGGPGPTNPPSDVDCEAYCKTVTPAGTSIEPCFQACMAGN